MPVPYQLSTSIMSVRPTDGATTSATNQDKVVLTIIEFFKIQNFYPANVKKKILMFLLQLFYFINKSYQKSDL